MNTRAQKAARDHHAGIHGLRGACVLAIFLYHVVNSGLLPPASTGFLENLRWLSDGLRYGVEVFFMISGYVIVHSLKRHQSVSLFLRDRVLRIFPLWIPLAIALMFGAWLAGQWTGSTIRHFPDPLLLIPSLLILAPVLHVPSLHPAQWSLCYELFFYGFSAVAWANRSRLLWCCVLSFIPACIFVIIFPRALFFIPGVLVALFEPQFRSSSAVFRWGWIGLPMAWVAWLSTGVENAGWSRTLIDLATQGFAPVTVLSFVGALFFFIWLVLFRASADRSILASPPMQWLGTISFSFYLVHPIVMGAVKQVILPVFQFERWTGIAFFVVVSLVVSCAASYFTWRLLEVGFRRWLASSIQTPAVLALRK